MKHTNSIAAANKLDDLIDSAKYWLDRADTPPGREYWEARVEMLEATKAIVAILDTADKPDMVVKLMEYLKL